MTRVSIDLPDDLRAKAEARAAEAGHGTLEQYLRALLHADIGTGEFLDEDLEELVLQRLDDRPSIEFTPQFAQDFKDAIRRRRQAGGSGT